MEVECRRAPIIIDGPNVACSFGTAEGKGKKASLFGVKLARAFFSERGHPVSIIFPQQWARAAPNSSVTGPAASLTDEERAEIADMATRGLCTLTPPGDYDDLYTISYAKDKGGFILTNDRFRDHTAKAADAEGEEAAEELQQWLRTNIIHYTFALQGAEFLPNPEVTAAASRAVAAGGAGSFHHPQLDLYSRLAAEEALQARLREEERKKSRENQLQQLVALQQQQLEQQQRMLAVLLGQQQGGPGATLQAASTHMPLPLHLASGPIALETVSFHAIGAAARGDASVSAQYRYQPSLEAEKEEGSGMDRMEEEDVMQHHHHVEQHAVQDGGTHRQAAGGEVSLSIAASPPVVTGSSLIASLAGGEHSFTHIPSYLPLHTSAACATTSISDREAAALREQLRQLTLLAAHSHPLFPLAQRRLHALLAPVQKQGVGGAVLPPGPFASQLMLWSAELPFAFLASLWLADVLQRVPYLECASSASPTPYAASASATSASPAASSGPVFAYGQTTEPAPVAAAPSSFPPATAAGAGPGGAPAPDPAPVAVTWRPCLSPFAAAVPAACWEPLYGKDPAALAGLAAELEGFHLAALGKVAGLPLVATGAAGAAGVGVEGSQQVPEQQQQQQQQQQHHFLFSITVFHSLALAICDSYYQEALREAGIRSVTVAAESRRKKGEEFPLQDTALRAAYRVLTAEGMTATAAAAAGGQAGVAAGTTFSYRPAAASSSSPAVRSGSTAPTAATARGGHLFCGHAHPASHSSAGLASNSSTSLQLTGRSWQPDWSFAALWPQTMSSCVSSPRVSAMLAGLPMSPQLLQRALEAEAEAVVRDPSFFTIHRFTDLLAAMRRGSEALLSELGKEFT